MSDLKLPEGLTHRENFFHFSKLHLDTGCPDPHLKIIVDEMKRIENPYDAAWLAGCYVGPYEVCTGALIAHDWNVWTTRKEPEKFGAWISDNWYNFNIRRERRAARTVKKMTECLLSYADFVCNRDKLSAVSNEGFDTLWKFADANLRYFGRYALIKLLHALHEGGLVHNDINDIRANGGWSPRETLALINGLEDTKDNKAPMITKVNTRAFTGKEELEDYLGKEVSWYDYEVLLCNYRQYPKHHPGWPHDSDLKYYLAFKSKFGEPSINFKAIRANLFHSVVLGEVNGWDGPREELDNTFYKYGYHWSDILYDYKTTTDLANPVDRVEMRG